MDFDELELSDDDLAPASIGNVQASPDIDMPCDVVFPHVTPAKLHYSDRRRASPDEAGTRNANSNAGQRRIPGPAGSILIQLDGQSFVEHPIDVDFQTDAWRCAERHATGKVPIASVGKSERVPTMVAVLSSICSSAGGNAYIWLKVPGSIFLVQRLGLPFIPVRGRLTRQPCLFLNVWRKSTCTRVRASFANVSACNKLSDCQNCSIQAFKLL